MRITQKTIWDYDEFLTGICEAAKDDDLDFVLLLIAAKTDIERAYCKQCVNYSALVTCYEDGLTKYTIIPHDFKL